MLGMLVLRFGGAWMIGACGSNDPGPANSCPTPLDTPTDTSTECAEPMIGACMLYRIPLLGNPSMNPGLRAKYIAAFGNACYMSESETPTFNCFYEKWEDACADAVKIAKVFGADPYKEGYECQPVGNGDYTLQVGPDVSNTITIYYEDAPLRSSLIDVKSVPTEVSGPYRNLVEVTPVKPDKGFYCTSGQVNERGEPLDQKEWILEVNRKAHKGEIHSDLAGFEYPCVKDCKKTTCIEPLVLKKPSDPYVYDPDEAQVHHVVPRKDPFRCRWGTNAYKNAAVISARLNQYLYNKVPPENEVVQINKVLPYTP